MFSKMNSHLHRIRSTLLHTAPPPSLFLCLFWLPICLAGYHWLSLQSSFYCSTPTPPKKRLDSAHTVLRLNTRFSFMLPFKGAVYGLKACPVQERFHQQSFLGFAQHVMCNSLTENLKKVRVCYCWWRGRRCFHLGRWIIPHGAPCLSGFYTVFNLAGA